MQGAVRNIHMYITLFIIGVVLIIALYYTNKLLMEGFASDVSSAAKLDMMNMNWRIMLKYMSDNPEKAMPFITDVKSKFFSDTCELKQPKIDYANLMDSYRPVFT
jgi:hypothetical protein